MRDVLSRRDFLKTVAISSAAWGTTGLASNTLLAVDYTRPVPGSENLTAYANGGQVLIRWNNTTVAAYRANPAQKYPYFHPLCGPVTGAPLTSESSVPYPHHRGLWLGCDPLNGGNYWSDGPLDDGQIRSLGITIDEEKTTGSSVVFHDRCRWQRAHGPSPFEDNRLFTFSAPSNQIRLLDVRLKLTATNDISIKRAKHSFFAMRCAADIAPMYGGVLANSEGGIGAQGTYGKTARWCGFYGKRSVRPDIVEGVAIMNHPDNFGGNCPWFTREYGHLSPSPFTFLKTPWILNRGESLVLNYRVVLHAGDPSEAKLDAIYDQWLEA